jgi:hypothetical protein
MKMLLDLIEGDGNSEISLASFAFAAKMLAFSSSTRQGHAAFGGDGLLRLRKS